MLGRFLSRVGCDLAVDLGTANTRIGALGDGLVLEEPSVVALHRATGQILSGGSAVGRLARQMLGRTPDSIDVVRPLREGVIADFRQCETMLRYFLRKSRRGWVGLKPRVLVPVPGGITPVQKRAVFNSAHRAGAGTVLVTNQALAAAIGVGLPVAEPVASMICDGGGGTTEVAVYSLGDAVAARSIRTAGDEMDQAVADYLLRHYSLRISLPAAESLKIELGSAHPLPREQASEIRGIDVAGGLPRRATITSEEVRQALAEPLARILQAVKDVVDGCGPELAADLVDQGIVLSGGGARLRGLDRFLADQTGLPVRVAETPETAVVQGALVCLEHRDRWRPALDSGDGDV